MSTRTVIALDGHDCAGKTTLATALAANLGGTAVRPFAGMAGAELLEAGLAGDFNSLVRIGSNAITKAIESVHGTSPVVLDRCWMTVASFVPESTSFFNTWNIWIPTVLCWSDIATTLSRFSTRTDDVVEPKEWHERYLAIYLDLAKRFNSPILRTDLLDTSSCISQIVVWVEQGINHTR